MANEKRGESKYALKRARRFSIGPVSKSLGEGQIARVGAEKAINPMPRPLDFSYFPKHAPKFQTLPGVEPMRHENVGMITRFRNRDMKYPGPARRKVIPMIAYDHEKMNYAGWNE
jgi:hypothetical protein